MEVIPGDFGRSTEENDAVPFRFGDRLAVGVAEAACRRELKVGDCRAVCGLAHVRIGAEVAEKDDFIYRCHCGLLVVFARARLRTPCGCVGERAQGLACAPPRRAAVVG